MTLLWSNIKVSFNQVSVLKNITGKTRSGLTVILGSNGSGKTTLLRTLAGHINTQSGSIKIGEKSITHLSSQARFKERLFYFPQSSLPIPDITPSAYLKLMAPKISEEKLFAHLNKKIKSEWESAFYYHMVPVAIRRIVDLAILCLLKPSFLLLDEPMAALGKEYIEKAKELVQLVQIESHVVIVEHRIHILKWASELGAYSYFFHNGSVALEGSLEGLIRDELVNHIYGSLV